MNFCKFHGFGNDYIVIENDQLSKVADIGEFAKEICHRNTGVGADGIAILEKLNGKEADYSCRIINPDGSEAGFSGNGTRCAVAYLYYKNLWREKSLRLQTKSGIKIYNFLKREENTFWFLAELGKPNFDLPDSPLFNAILEGKDKTQEAASFSILLPEEKIVINFFFVDVGNPVACIFVEDFNMFDWRHIGQKIEQFEEIFPDRTNVVFVKVINEGNVEIRIWERGAGETSSSGTCSIAAAVASAFTNKTNREVLVHAEGGATKAIWREDGEMLITGRADLAFCGEIIEKT
ncbi:MAG: diaminopimelate epimerase [Acidobacteria bacterium]|nr:diaminopimelate epimerase [Acidobacteriota bacterium]